MPNRFGKRARASRANDRARALAEDGQDMTAIAEYERAIQIDPTWSVPFYNLGLVYKYAGEWELSLENNRRAAELAPDDQAGWWNLAIAATALGRWDVARFAWRGAKIAVPDGEGPVDFPCGRACVRLNPDTEAEVVWVSRIDPARAELDSIPLPDSGFRFADVVLHDGAANGYRSLGDGEVPVFDCLRLMAPSRFSTWVATIDLDASPRSAGSSPIDALVDLAREHDLAAEDWSTSTFVLCKACSEGRPHDQHEEQSPKEPGRSHTVGIAAPDAAQARRLLDEWKPHAPGATVLTLELALASSLD